MSAQKSEFHVLIPASGYGARMESGTPKQYLKINGKSILYHTVIKFLALKECASVRVIIDPNHANLYRDAVQNLPLAPPVMGGKTRKCSVYNGLCSFLDMEHDAKILIHDAVRPLISDQDIMNIVQALDGNEAATLGHPVNDTLRRGEDIIDREGLWSIATPQGFHYGIIKRAHEEGKNLDVTDDTALVSALGLPVKLIEGSKTNIKITQKDDLMIAEKLMTQNFDTRTGTGFDVHAFEDGRPLILCGIKIDHPRGLKGHSDADVGLHAITDALLGAIGEGDIGLHFPPSNSEFKDMDSAVFLKHAADLITQKDGIIQNIDLTLICEEPKIGPYASQMRQKIAQILNIDENQVNIKATTTEGLGFTGRKEGIAAQAIATIKVPS